MKWASRILQGLLVLDFLFAGATKIFSSTDQIRELFTDKLGTPVALIYTVGVFEALAALVLLAGYRSHKAAVASIAVMLVILIGATVTNLVAGLVGDAMVPFVILIFVAILMYLKRDSLKSFAGANSVSK
ncbi:DoxX family protein [Cohnella nanjingensis]|uniref:DoxX family protein n=1 Tax=Cohnella nanjingensis TaxID=1387779 RepID=A0A7X0RWZ5_9BACL|nr:DoxX family protein [Cohnella nanjingensis]MBB6673654.1 DoxX family protein [Cohnella nanjingensis]